MSGQNFSRSKSSSSTGKNAPMKKTGYASGRVPDSMVGAKVGITNKKGYSGPNVTQGSFGK